MNECNQITLLQSKYEKRVVTETHTRKKKEQNSPPVSYSKATDKTTSLCTSKINYNTPTKTTTYFQILQIICVRIIQRLTSLQGINVIMGDL